MGNVFASGDDCKLFLIRLGLVLARSNKLRRVGVGSLPRRRQALFPFELRRERVADAAQLLEARVEHLWEKSRPRFASFLDGANALGLSSTRVEAS